MRLKLEGGGGGGGGGGRWLREIMVCKNARAKQGMQEYKSARKREGNPQCIFSHASDFLPPYSSRTPTTEAIEQLWSSRL